MPASYLLDTQALLWVARSPEKLGKNSRHTLQRAIGVLYSSVSIAELEVKQLIGKIGRSEELQALLASSEIGELPFTSEHAREISRFGTLSKHDPFDRFIVAQAAAENCQLITADQKLLDLGFDWILDARE